MRTATPMDSARLFAAVEKLAVTESLGPAEFRAAIAGWMHECAVVTKRVEGQISVAQSLPCVLKILDVIEAAG